MGDKLLVKSDFGFDVVRLSHIRSFMFSVMDNEVSRHFRTYNKYQNFVPYLRRRLIESKIPERELLIQFDHEVANKTAYFLVDENAGRELLEERSQFDGSIIHYTSTDMIYILTGCIESNTSYNGTTFCSDPEHYEKVLGFPGYKKNNGRFGNLCWIPEYTGPAKRVFTKQSNIERIEVIPEIFDKFGQKFELGQAVLFQGTVKHNDGFYIGTIEKIYSSGNIRINLLQDDGTRAIRVVNDPKHEMLVMNEDFFQNVVIHKLTNA